MELDLDPAVLVGVNLLTSGSDDHGGLDVRNARSRSFTLWTVGYVDRNAAESVPVARAAGIEGVFHGEHEISAVELALRMAEELELLRRGHADDGGLPLGHSRVEGLSLSAKPDLGVHVVGGICSTVVLVKGQRPVIVLVDLSLRGDQRTAG